MREREDLPRLRRQSMSGSPHPTSHETRSFSIPPLNRVLDHDRSASFSPNPSTSRQLRHVSSSGSVRDLVKGFEGLAEETEEDARRSTSRSLSRATMTPPPPRPRWSGGSINSSSSSSQGGYPRRSGLGDVSTSTDESGDTSLGSGQVDASFLHGNISTSSVGDASFVREIVVPKRKAIPATAAPRKKRMTWLGREISDAANE